MNMDKNKMVYASAAAVALVLVAVLVLKTRNNVEPLPGDLENDNGTQILPTTKTNTPKKTTAVKSPAAPNNENTSTSSSGSAAAPAKITQEEAVSVAKTRYPGEVTSVTLDNKNGKDIYIVQINYNADNGSEAIVWVDAYTGEILSSSN